MNLVFEETPENVLYEAVCLANKDWSGVLIEDYTATESVVVETIEGMKIIAYTV